MIDVHPTFAGGGFGRRVDDRCVEDAVLIAKEIGKPVKVLSRSDDGIRHGLYRPLAAQHLQATVGAEGKISG